MRTGLAILSGEPSRAVPRIDFALAQRRLGAADVPGSGNTSFHARHLLFLSDDRRCFSFCDASETHSNSETLFDVHYSRHDVRVSVQIA